jgi:hypothetical protein
MRIALVENDRVNNVVIADNLEAIRQLFSHFTVLEESDDTSLAWIGARYNGVRFEAPRTYGSWNWNEKTFTYDPPTPKPQGSYYWDEAELAWVELLTDEEYEAIAYANDLDYQGRPTPAESKDTSVA